jgi:hypothetical protein
VDAQPHSVEAGTDELAHANDGVVRSVSAACVIRAQSSDLMVVLAHPNRFGFIDYEAKNADERAATIDAIAPEARENTRIA